MNNELLNKKILFGLIAESLEEKVAKQIAEGYSNPLNELINEVVKEHSETLKEKVSKMLIAVLADKEFDKIIVQEFKHKIAKSLVSKLEGTVERSVESFRNDPTLRAKVVTAIENIVNKNQ